MVYQIILLYILKHSWESSLNKVYYKKILKPKNVFGDLKKLPLILPFSIHFYSSILFILCHLILVLVSSTEDI